MIHSYYFFFSYFCTRFNAENNLFQFSLFSSRQKEFLLQLTLSCNNGIKESIRLQKKWKWKYEREREKPVEAAGRQGRKWKKRSQLSYLVVVVSNIYTNCYNILKRIRFYHLHCSLLLTDLAEWIVRLISTACIPIHTHLYFHFPNYNPIIVFAISLSRSLDCYDVQTKLKKGVKSFSSSSHLPRSLLLSLTSTHQCSMSWWPANCMHTHYEVGNFSSEFFSIDEFFSLEIIVLHFSFLLLLPLHSTSIK